ncbi:MAG: tape measure protein [Weeksellaceae bacterium]
MASLEFIVKLQDQFSAVSDKVNAGFDKMRASSNKMNSSIDSLRSRMEMAHSFMQKTTDKNAFRYYYEEAKKLEKQIAKLESGITGMSVGGKLSEWRNDFASSLPGADLMKNPIAMAGAAVGGFWVATNKAMEAGKEKMKMQVLTGSEEIGTTLYNGLTKFATDTVFGSEVYDMASQMLANGIKDADVMPLMKQLGDISMGDANKLGSLSLAFSQINSAGRLLGQDLNQMINAGFNPLQVISEKTGESMTSLKDKMVKGQITIDDVKYAMSMATGEGGKFAGMLEKVADTPYGQLEGLRGQMDQLVISIGEEFIPVATKMMKAISWLGEKAGPILKPFAFILGVVSVAILGMAAAQWVLNLAVWSFPGTWIVAAIVAIIAIVYTAITKWHQFGAAILQLMGPIGWLINAFMSLKEHWESVKNAFTTDGIIGGLKRLHWVLLDTFLKPLKQILELIEEFDPSGMAGKALKRIDLIRESQNLVSANERNARAGIADPAGVPGAGGGLSKGGAAKAGKEKAKKTNSAIATGGTKHNYITINLKDLVGVLNIDGKSFKETTTQMEEQVLDALLRVTASATTAGG